MPSCNELQPLQPARGAELSKISLAVYDWTQSSSVVQKHDLPGRGVFGTLLNPLLSLALLESHRAVWDLLYPHFVGGEVKAWAG